MFKGFKKTEKPTGAKGHEDVPARRGSATLDSGKGEQKARRKSSIGAVVERESVLTENKIALIARLAENEQTRGKINTVEAQIARLRGALEH